MTLLCIKYDATTFLVYYPNSNRHASSEMSSPQYSCAFHYRTCAIMLDSCLGNKSDIFHHNNKNNQLERQVWPPKDNY